MNITEETNDYFSTTGIIKSGGVIIKYPCERLDKYYDIGDVYCNANSDPTEKLVHNCRCDYSTGRLRECICRATEELSDVIITDLKDGDILDECDNGVYINKRCENETEFIKYMDKEFNNADWNDQQVWDNLRDKLKTTPNRGIKKISKVFRVNWSKVFKRGWLLWK